MTRGEQSARQGTVEIGIPHKTLYKWVELTRKDRAAPFGSGSRRAEDQAVDQLRRRVRDLEEDNAL